MTYREKEDLRSDISILREIIHWMETEKPELTRRQILEKTAKQKRRIREKIKRYDNRVDDIHYDEDGEGCWWKEYFNEPFTEEEKREFIKDRWVHIYSPYDCTGQWFTSHIAVCNVETSFGTKSVAYFFMGLDV